MGVQEFRYIFLGLVILFLAYIAAAFVSLSILPFVSIFSIILGAALVFFGFWGADYAFSAALGELDQSRRRGKVKGKKGEVYVPFVGNYTATEWWNINWALTVIGALLLALGTLSLGIYLGSAGLL